MTTRMSLPPLPGEQYAILLAIGHQPADTDPASLTTRHAYTYPAHRSRMTQTEVCHLERSVQPNVSFL